jgi:hypothetical protein
MNQDYGYSQSFRNQVLRDAEIYGVADAAARHSVSKASIYNWRKKVDEVEQESWIEICARQITPDRVMMTLIGFVGIVAVAHAIEFFLSR